MGDKTSSPKSNKEKKHREELINSTIIGMSLSDEIQKHGEATSQMPQALKGVRYDTNGSNLGHTGRSLKGISKYKINDNYRKLNIKQQSGFSAELIKEARDNKEAIKKGNPTRVRTTDGIGQSNNEKYDHVKLDAKGHIIDGTGSQMKFLGVDAKGKVTVIEKIVSEGKWQKYDGVIDIPKDQYDLAVNYAEKQALQLREQAQNLRNKGNYEKAVLVEERAKKYENAKNKVRKSNVTQKEAINARMNPEKSVAKEVLIDSHNAGVEMAKGAIIMSAGVVSAQNLYCVIKGEKDIEEAVVDITKDTAKAGAVAYGVGFTGTILKSIMHSSKNSIVRQVGTTKAPAMIVTATIEVTKSIKRYAVGEINEVELLEELGEKGTGMVAAAYGSAVGAVFGNLVLPGVGGPVGGFVGSLVGYTASSILYKGTLEALKNAEVSAERRKVIEEMSASCIQQMKEYQEILSAYAEVRFNQREKLHTELLEEMQDSLVNGNIDGFMRSINVLGREFGVEFQFCNFKEFDDFMIDDNLTLIL